MIIGINYSSIEVTSKSGTLGLCYEINGMKSALLSGFAVYIGTDEYTGISNTQIFKSNYKK